MSRIRRKIMCPHCNSQTIQRLLWSHTYDENRGGLWKDGEAEYPSQHHIFACETCDEVILYHINDADDSTNIEEWQDELELVWPKRDKFRELPQSVPQTIKDRYLEASRVEEIEPNAFAVLIRKALEAICNEQYVKGNFLGERLNLMAGQGLFPGIIADIADEIKTIGNLGAHDKSLSVRPIQVEAIDDFFHLVIQYVYDAPTKLSEFHRLVGIEMDKSTGGDEIIH